MLSSQFVDMPISSLTALNMRRMSLAKFIVTLRGRNPFGSCIPILSGKRCGSFIIHDYNKMLLQNFNLRYIRRIMLRWNSWKNNKRPPCQSQVTSWNRWRSMFALAIFSWTSPLSKSSRQQACPEPCRSLP